MRFENIEFLWLLLTIFPILFLKKANHNSFESCFDKEILKKMTSHNKTLSLKIRELLFVGALASAIIALARPIIDNGQIKVNSSNIDIMVGFDISNSMFSDDIYPNRFEFSKIKFDEFLSNLKDAKVGVFGFSSQAFLISPLTRDFNTLKFLVKNMKFDYVSLKGTSIISALEVTNDLLKDSKQKVLLLFSDGGDKSDYSQEISYAKNHNIAIYIYATATQKGGVIKTKNGVFKDKNGDIVVVKRNDKIKELALQSGGAYLAYSLSKNDIKAITQDIKSKFKNHKRKSKTIRDTKELFYYPLLLAILLFIISFSSLPTRKQR